MAQGSFHDCCMPHRVDAAARPNLYPDWPETPEDASILVNHTARLLDHVYLGASAYCFMDPRPSIRSVRRPSRVFFLFLYAAPPILPDGSLAKHASDHFPLPSRSRPFSFCISKHFWGGARAFLRWMMRSAKPPSVQRVGSGSRPRVRVSTWSRCFKDRRCCAPRLCCADYWSL
jgi:hypothetical protein